MALESLHLEPCVKPSLPTRSADVPQLTLRRSVFARTTTRPPFTPSSPLAHIGNWLPRNLALGTTSIGTLNFPSHATLRRESPMTIDPPPLILSMGHTPAAVIAPLISPWIVIGRSRILGWDRRVFAGPPLPLSSRSLSPLLSRALARSSWRVPSSASRIAG